MQRGSLKVIRLRGVRVWRLQWRESGKGRSRILGKCSEMTRDQANAERNRILQGINAGEIRHTKAITLLRFVEDEYLPVRNRKWKASTRATTEQIIRDHILAPFGKRTLVAVTRKELQAHLDEMAKAELSFSLVAHTRWQMAAIFSMACADGLTAGVDAGAELVIPRCVTAPEKRTITADQIRKAQMSLELRERLIFQLAVIEGMRPGEIVALQPRDYRDGMLHVVRRVYRGKLDEPKSKKSRRPVALSETTRRLLDSWLELTSDSTWVFASESGTPLSYSNVWRRRIGPALKNAGLEGVNYQILRRTAVTEMSQVVQDPTLRAQHFGHNVDVDENTYRQAKPEALKRAMRKVEKRLQ